ncbi:hypothetical protein HZC30_07190 [Candidatus Woesearchaeota archaeon]|nr:hypothetical protein [Candidatus Woesearchaeota archaeon]
MKDITEMLVAFEALKKSEGINLEETERKSNLNIDERKLQFEMSYISHMIKHFEVMGRILENIPKDYLKGTIFDLGCGTACTDWNLLC